MLDDELDKDEIALQSLIGMFPEDTKFPTTFLLDVDYSYLAEQLKPITPEGLSLNYFAKLSLDLTGQQLLGIGPEMEFFSFRHREGRQVPRVALREVRFGDLTFGYRILYKPGEIDSKRREDLASKGIDVALSHDMVFDNLYNSRREHDPEIDCINMPHQKLEELLNLLPGDRFRTRLLLCSIDHSSLLQQVASILKCDIKDHYLKFTAMTGDETPASKKQLVELCRLDEERMKVIKAASDEAMALHPKKYSDIREQHPELFARMNLPYVKINATQFHHHGTSITLLGKSHWEDAKEKVKIEYRGVEPDFLKPFRRRVEEDGFEVSILANADRIVF